MENNNNVFQIKCPNCSSNDIELNISHGKLRCKYCGTEFNDSKFNEKYQDPTNIQGTNLSRGTEAINVDNQLVMEKCLNCGAEITFRKEDEYVKCHWCGAPLSLKTNMESSIVPDQILPFTVSKEEAVQSINDYLNKRTFFAKKVFKSNANLDSVHGVYLPFMLIDVNCHCNLNGIGDHLVERIHNDNSDIVVLERYDFKRDFDFALENILIAAKESMKRENQATTSYIFDAIGNYDIENCVKYVPNYMIGYTSEKRDLEISTLDQKLCNKIEKVAKLASEEDIGEYNYDVTWKDSKIDIKGTQWSTAYLPVWLYSYYEKKKNIIHYIAVNGRNKLIAGSVPFNKPLALIVSFLQGLLFGGLLFGLFWLVGLRPSVVNEIGLVALPSVMFSIGISLVIFVAIFVVSYSNKKDKYDSKQVDNGYENKINYQKGVVSKQDNFIKKYHENEFGQSARMLRNMKNERKDK